MGVLVEPIPSLILLLAKMSLIFIIVSLNFKKNNNRNPFSNYDQVQTPCRNRRILRKLKYQKQTTLR